MKSSWDLSPTHHTWRTPFGHVAVPEWAHGHWDHTRSHWARTREDRLNGLLQRGNAAVVDTRDPWSSLADAVKVMADHLAPEETEDIPVWEIDTRGSIRRGSFRPEIRPPTSTQDVSLDTSPERLAGGDFYGYRERKLDDINLPEGILVNWVASYMGRPVTNEIGWTTAAPVTGSTPNWNGSTVRKLSWSGHATSFERSRAAAMVEGIERRVGALQTTGITTVATRRELPGRVITPEDFPFYPEDFYRHRGARFDDSTPHEWIRGRSLVTDEAVWIPREYVFYGEQMGHQRWALSTSSGCATGSSTVEAALFGLLELLERDAFLASWYGRIPARKIVPESVPGLDPILDRARLLGFEIEVGLLPSPTGVPVAVAVASAPQMRAVGAACHPDPSVALTQAVEEAWTFLPERVRLARLSATRVAEMSANPLRVFDIEDHPLVFAPGHDPGYDEICGAGQAVTLDEIREDLLEHASCTSAELLLERLVQDLAQAGVESYAYVQTSELERGLGLETVMVLAPGLLPIDFGWGNQRALTSPRLAELAQRFTGEPLAPRILPHPFS